MSKKPKNKVPGVPFVRPENRHQIEHNFKTLEFGYPTLDGVEIKGIDCFLSDRGFSIGKIGKGATCGNTDQNHEQKRANAKRIALCVNFCKDKTNKDLGG